MSMLYVVLHVDIKEEDKARASLMRWLIIMYIPLKICILFWHAIFYLKSVYVYICTYFKLIMSCLLLFFGYTTLRTGFSLVLVCIFVG